MEKYFDKDCFINITIIFPFMEIKNGTKDLLNQTELLKYFNQAKFNNTDLIIETTLREFQSSFYYVISCKRDNFEMVQSLILDLLTKDNNYLFSIGLTNETFNGIFLDYDKGISLKISKEHIEKYHNLATTSISLESQNKQEYEEENYGKYLQLYFEIDNKNDISLEKIKESWFFFLSEKYLDYQKIELHKIQENNKTLLVISVSEEDIFGNELYLDMCSFIRIYYSFLQKNNIDVNLVLLHRFYNSGEANISGLLQLNTNLIIIKSNTKESPSFLDIYKSFG